MKREKTTAILLITIFMVSVMAAIIPVMAQTHEPILDPNPKRKGWVHWVWIEYEWHSEEWSDFVTWTVYAYDCNGNPPKAKDAPFGTQLAYTAEPDWGNWEDNYADKFELIGNTLQFDEEYVPTTDAHPQINHVVLHRVGDGVYEGKDTTYYTITSRPDYVHMDVNMYRITVDEDGNVIDYYSEEHEYYQYIGE